MVARASAILAVQLVVLDARKIIVELSLALTASDYFLFAITPLKFCKYYLYRLYLDDRL